MFKSFELFSGAPPGFYDIIRVWAKQKSFKRGDLILDYGEPVEHVYLILEGGVKIFMQDRPIKNLPLKALKDLETQNKHPMRRDIPQKIKDYEVAIKLSGDTFLEDYFGNKKTSLRLSRHKVMVTSFELKVVSIDF